MYISSLKSFFNFLSKKCLYIMICLLSFFSIYIYIKFEEFSRVLSYKKQCICIGYVHNFDDFLKFIHSVFYLLIPTCKAKSVFYLLTISFLIFYLLDPYYILTITRRHIMCVYIIINRCNSV